GLLGEFAKSLRRFATCRLVPLSLLDRSRCKRLPAPELFHEHRKQSHQDWRGVRDAQSPANQLCRDETLERIERFDQRLYLISTQCGFRVMRELVANPVQRHQAGLRSRRDAIKGDGQINFEWEASLRQVDVPR